MSCRQLEMFVTIAEAGSMHAAARRLGATAQGMSRALARYDDDVPAMPFVRDRRARGAFPTLPDTIAVGWAREMAGLRRGRGERRNPVCAGGCGAQAGGGFSSLPPAACLEPYPS